jgi:hypothetical protein
MPSVPSHTNSPANLPVLRTGPHPIYYPNHLMPGNPRIVKPWEAAFFYDGISVAYPTGLDFDENLVFFRLENFSVDDLKAASRRADLNCFHQCHETTLDGRFDMLIQYRSFSAEIVRVLSSLDSSYLDTATVWYHPPTRARCRRTGKSADSGRCCDRTIRIDHLRCECLFRNSLQRYALHCIFL